MSEVINYVLNNKLLEIKNNKYDINFHNIGVTIPSKDFYECCNNIIKKIEMQYHSICTFNNIFANYYGYNFVLSDPGFDNTFELYNVTNKEVVLLCDKLNKSTLLEIGYVIGMLKCRNVEIEHIIILVDMQEFGVLNQLETFNISIKIITTITDFVID